MKSQLFFSDQREKPSAAILKAGSGEEDTFLWSMADLLTLLLIFFIYLYAQSSGQFLSSAATSQPSNAATPVPPVHLASAVPAQEESPVFEPVSIRPIIIPPLTDASPTGGAETKSAVFSAPEVPELPREPQKITTSEVSPPAEGAMKCLRQAALSAIRETEKSACSIRWNQDRLVFILGERLTFPVGEARLLTDFQPTLDRIARLIADKKEYRVMVSGHTDDTPIATDEFPSNWELSAARAITVAKSIIQSGVDPHRITIQGHGEFRPLHENSSPENREANRRVEIALFMEKNKEENPETIY